MGRYSGKKCRLVSMFGLTSSFFLVEIIVGYVTNSMALVADSFHMLSDIAALCIAFLSVKMAPKSWDKNTYGWARAEVSRTRQESSMIHLASSDFRLIFKFWDGRTNGQPV